MSNLVGRKLFDLLQAWGISESNRLNHKDQRSPASLVFHVDIWGDPRWALELVEQRFGLLTLWSSETVITSVFSVMSARVKGQNITYLQAVLEEGEKRRSAKELHESKCTRKHF